MPCLVIHLRYSTSDNRWHLFAGTRHIMGFNRKPDGEEVGRDRCNLEYVQGGEARLVVHRADGTVELQYSYTRPRTLFCPAVPMTLAALRVMHDARGTEAPAALSGCRAQMDASP